MKDHSVVVNSQTKARVSAQVEQMCLDLDEVVVVVFAPVAVKSLVTAGVVRRQARALMSQRGYRFHFDVQPSSQLSRRCVRRYMKHWQKTTICEML